jgi:hypothetical protein
MTHFEMLTIIGSILIPMLAGFGWIINKIFELQKEILHLSQDIQKMDNRLCRLEGYIEGRDIYLKVKGD